MEISTEMFLKRVQNVVVFIKPYITWFINILDYFSIGVLFTIVGFSLKMILVFILGSPFDVYFDINQCFCQ